MPLISTGTLKPGPFPPALGGSFAQQQCYNGLDAAVTLEIHEALQGISNALPEVYDFERALQGPMLEIMLRGFRIDECDRQAGIALMKGKLSRLNAILNSYALAVWGRTLNANSPKQMLEFFYGALGLPEQWSFKKGVRKLSMDREALEKLEIFFHARPIISVVLAIRDATKTLSVLETEVDGDGRMRTSYNIAGTETWRLSSSSNAFGAGTNLQNISPELRRMFVADPGFKLFCIDLEQTESREVGWMCGMLFDDWTYLDACEAGDLHTVVCRYNWNELPWTGDKKLDRAIADEIFYRIYSRRDMAKKLGHGSNYYGQPPTMARHAKIEVPMAERFQKRYFSQFPAIPRWHRWALVQLQTKHEIPNAFGVIRTFFGRVDDDATLREAIAFGPQSSTAIRTNLALYRIWRAYPQIQLLGQVHDCVIGQYPETSDERELLPALCKTMEVWLTDPKSGRKFTVPGEAKIGWNWGNWSDKSSSLHSLPNPDGLRKFSLTSPDLRTRTPLLSRTF